MYSLFVLFPRSLHMLTVSVVVILSISFALFDVIALSQYTHSRIHIHTYITDVYVHMTTIVEKLFPAL